jgi:hypothetical protein
MKVEFETNEEELLVLLELIIVAVQGFSEDKILSESTEAQRHIKTLNALFCKLMTEYINKSEKSDMKIKLFNTWSLANSFSHNIIEKTKGEKNNG